MRNKLIVAAAGSGKTTFLVKESLKIKDKSILITTFTEANGHEIEKKFYEINGCVPMNVRIQTWFSLLLEHGVKPFQGDLYDNKVNGILLANQKSGIKYYCRCGKPVYWSEEEFEKYYFSKDGLVYTDKLSKLVLRINDNVDNLVFKRISYIFSYIFIDEIQDLAGYDLEIVKSLLQLKSSILMVGDPRQVTYHTHDERKYAKYKEGKIIEFIENECKGIECEIDCEELNISYRNNVEICSFANKVYPNFKDCKPGQFTRSEHDGVFLIKESDIDRYLEVYKPMQLRDSRRTRVNDTYPAMNIGNSKGVTFDRVLIYPTKPMKDWLQNHCKELKAESRAKLYVALTRARYSVGIVINYTEKTNIEGTCKYIN